MGVRLASVAFVATLASQELVVGVAPRVPLAWAFLAPPAAVALVVSLVSRVTQAARVALAALARTATAARPVRTVRTVRTERMVSSVPRALRGSLAKREQRDPLARMSSRFT